MRATGPNLRIAADLCALGLFSCGKRRTGKSATAYRLPGRERELVEAVVAITGVRGRVSTDSHWARADQTPRSGTSSSARLRGLSFSLRGSGSAGRSLVPCSTI